MHHNERTGGGWLTPVLAGLALGAMLQVQEPALRSWQHYAAAAAFALALLLAGVRVAALVHGAAARAASRCLLALLVAGFLAFSLCGLRAVHFSAQALDPLHEGRDITVTGRVSAMPQRSDLGLRFRFDVEAASETAASGAAPVRLPPRLYLSWYGGVSAGPAGTIELQRAALDVRAGERWRMNVRLKAPHGNSNPHGFDYELWLWEQGLQATGYVRSGVNDPAPRLLADTWRHPVERARQAVRDAVFAQVQDRKTAGVLAALIVGDQNAIDKGDWDVFRATGVAHLMSISGLHVTMFAWVAGCWVGWLWRRSQRLCLTWPAQHAALVGGVLLATGYALFSGWGVPAQRTVWMLATVGLLRLAGRRWPWPQVWLCACAIVVTIQPWAVLQPGFWLSFVAVGVLFATDLGQQVRPAHGGPGKALAGLRAMLREQWVVTLALTPLTLLLFGQVSLVGLLANAVAIPWVTLIITPLALAGVLVHPLWHLAGGAVQGLEFLLQWLAAVPFAALSMPAPPLWAGVAGVLGGLLLAIRLPWHARLLGLPLLLPALLWQPARPLHGQFELLAADIGQGNAVIVRTASHTLVYDAGPRYGAESDAGHRVVVPLLRAMDERVDTLVLSHRDSDHTGGAAAVLATQAGAALLSSIEDGHELQALRPSTRCSAGQRWNWNGVDFHVVHPMAADYNIAAPKPNTMSCVLRISNGTHTALLAGDIELAQELRLAALADAQQPGASNLRAHVLLVPHHGSKTSSSAAFLEAVQPSIAIVQAGYRNRFGHPAPAVLERYRERGVRVVDTPRCGAARWESSRPLEVSCHRQLAARYWHHRFP
jgi:competence protein ComEC